MKYPLGIIHRIIYTTNPSCNINHGIAAVKMTQNTGTGSYIYTRRPNFVKPVNSENKKTDLHKSVTTAAKIIITTTATTISLL